MEYPSHQTEDFGSHATPMDMDPVNLTDEQTIHNDKVNLHGPEGVSSPTHDQHGLSDDFTLPDRQEMDSEKDFRSQDPGPSQATEILNLSEKGNSSPEDVLEIETQRNAVSDIGSETFLFSANHGNDVTEPRDPPTNQKAILS
ncbi:uncharacterized protein LOC126787101 [Argentina anserina]|uniref:uncharacterized protein LOC126787101 n=1 Tax=Argentina anserina TaxID=57926 RepID=UPI002176631D|nr:uncharacterized protein LOC126787101 [Potentilla anserina]